MLRKKLEKLFEGFYILKGSIFERLMRKGWMGFWTNPGEELLVFLQMNKGKK